ncbi:MAG: enoyl-CoA hydratase/isomerase family protein [Novosphingobium sp.]|nr:enoyl-CoA hydratase/isomerase family protein [Novosphingobium sp.]
MDYKTIRVETTPDGVAHLTLAQGDRGNPIDGQFCAEFVDGANDLSASSAVRAILLGADGKNFSVGGDISAFVKNLDQLPVMIRKWTSGFHGGIARLQRADAPVVAAVQGICAGGGVALAAAADYVVADDDARFVSAYTGIGYPCDGGASVFLSARLGAARAKRFLMMREMLSAQQALELGLVDELVPAGNAAARAAEVAAELAAGPTFAYGELKRIFVSAASNSLDTQLEVEALAIARCAGTADSREAITAFAEKRKPAFKGN